MNARRKTIGRLAAEAGVHVETVRYYERKGLIRQPPARAGGREYGPEALWQLRYIKHAQSWGWRLSEIAELLASAEASPNFCAAIREAARRRLREIDRQVAQLKEQQAQLESFFEACAAKPDADRCPIFKRVTALG